MYNRISTIIVAVALVLWAGAAAAAQIYSTSTSALSTGPANFNQLSVHQLAVGSAQSATLATVAVPVTTGTLKQLACVVDTVPGSISKSWTFTLVKNAVDTSMSCAISGTIACPSVDCKCSNGTSVAVAAGDRVAIKHVQAGAPPGGTGARCTVRFD